MRGNCSCPSSASAATPVVRWLSHAWPPSVWTIGATWAIAGLLVLNGLLGLRKLAGGGQAGIGDCLGLFRPDWWWCVALALALASPCALYRLRGRKAWSAVVPVRSLLGIMALVTGFSSGRGSTWDLMRYYPVKALWTAIVAVISSWRSARRRALRRRRLERGPPWPANWAAPVRSGLRR